MAIKAKPTGAKPNRCGICPATPRCPSCPEMDGKIAKRETTFADILGRDPELGHLQRLNAIAARNIAIRKESEPGYLEWVTEYQRLGDQLRQLYERRPALLGPQAHKP